MGVVALKTAGFIFQDSFTDTTLDERWELSPNDTSRISLLAVPGSLRLIEGAEPLHLFLSELTGISKFVLDVKNVFNPTTAPDIGGLRVFKNEEETILFEEYYDAVEGVVNTYPWLRLVREGNTYFGYWSDDGVVWSMEGTDSFSGNAQAIGAFLAGGSSIPMDLESVRVMKSTKIRVENLLEGFKVELLNTSDVVVRTKVCRAGNTTIDLDSTGLTLPFSGKFRVTLPGDLELQSEEVLTIWGGDEYIFQPNVDLYYLDAEDVEHPLQENVEEFIGYLNSAGVMFSHIKMIARNNFETIAFDTISVTVAQYHGTNQYLLTSVAPDVAGSPGVFTDSVDIASLAVSSSQPFWLKVNREVNETVMTSEVYFGLDVVSTYTL